MYLKPDTDTSLCVPFSGGFGSICTCTGTHLGKVGLSMRTAFTFYRVGNQSEGYIQTYSPLLIQNRPLGQPNGCTAVVRHNLYEIFGNMHGALDLVALRKKEY